MRQVNISTNQYSLKNTLRFAKNKKSNSRSRLRTFPTGPTENLKKFKDLRARAFFLYHKTVQNSTNKYVPCPKGKPTQWNVFSTIDLTRTVCRDERAILDGCNCRQRYWDASVYPVQCLVTRSKTHVGLTSWRRQEKTLKQRRWPFFDAR
jgi:hypothetical protein